MPPTFYEILGVTHDEDIGVIRKAYVDRAWRYHPDRNIGQDQTASAERMRALNEAWHTISDADRRKEYDKRLTFSGKLHGTAQEENSTSREWVPFDTSEPEDIDFDDRPVAGSKPIPRWLTLAPVVAIVFGVLTAGLGTLVKSGGMFSLGLVVIVMAAAGFLLVPLVAMSRAERDPNL